MRKVRMMIKTNPIIDRPFTDQWSFLYEVMHSKPTPGNDNNRL